MNKKLIRLTESDLHKIVKESVNRVLREHDYRDNAYDEGLYDELVNGSDKEEAWYQETNKEYAKRFVSSYKRNGYRFDDWNYGSGYQAANKAADILYNFRHNKKFLETMDVTFDDIVYLLRMGEEDKLEDIYDELEKKREEYFGYLRNDKYFKSDIARDFTVNHYTDKNHIHVAADAAEGNVTSRIKDGTRPHPADDANLNVFDNGYGGDASLAAQGAFGKEGENLAKNLRGTVRGSYDVWKKNK